MNEKITGIKVKIANPIKLGAIKLQAVSVFLRLSLLPDLFLVFSISALLI
jgi:hypothetical protein